MEKETKVCVLKSTLRLVKMVFQRGKWYIVLQLFLRIVCGLLPVATALLWQRVLHIIEIDQIDLSVNTYFIALAIIGGLSASYFYFTEVMDTLIRNKISITLQKEVHKQAAKLPMDDYESDNLIDMLDRAGKVFCYGDAIGLIMAVFGVVQQAVSVVTIIHAVWNFHFMLAMGALLLIVPGGVKLFLNRMHIDLEFHLSPKRREVSVLRKYLTEKNFIKDLHIMNSGRYLVEKWEGLCRDVCEEEKKINGKIVRIRIMTDLIERSATIISYGICLYLVINRYIDIASFGAIIVLINQFIQNTSRLINQINGIQGEALSIHRAIGYFDLECENRNKGLQSVEEINLDNVTYCYPGNVHCAVSNISLRLHKGELIVIVGQNGSGKTTLSKLILGLISPDSGVITAADESLDQVEYSSLYKHFSAVFQDFCHYSTTVKNNIVISNSEIEPNDRELYELINKLGISFIGEGKSLSLETELGVEYGGTDLSGGQWQQLAIVRAAYRKSEVIVLDEPSSAVDPLREAELFNTFKAMCKDRIGIIVSHRLGVCALADKIIVMEGGKIVESGTLNGLLNEKGNFAKLYSSQRDMYKNNGTNT